MSRAKCLLGIVLWLLGTQMCFAELYQYTDNNGVIHFTDDPAKVPARHRDVKQNEPSLSLSDKNMVKHLMEKDGTKDAPVKNITEFKKTLKDFSSSYKEKYDDPDQKPDSRLSTPEGTLRLFLSGLRQRNLNDIRASITSRLWNSSGNLFNKLSAKQFSDFEKLISKRKMEKKEQTEHYVIFALIDTLNGQEVEVGTVEIINLFGNWKVNRL
ncbi:DUF4124 domain-containing protein [Geomonas ferrireducens]|uniref:DUF4124 domain-containing protein n=1 Tax=Geomonas ferrireducens TaxID=2570227 RepID=UPI0010A80DB9|nr:DUF4124 domain-containing protein [Geomonas ferrireducens]